MDEFKTSLATLSLEDLEELRKQINAAMYSLDPDSFPPALPVWRLLDGMGVNILSEELRREGL